jgi:hypothetical protein
MRLLESSSNVANLSGEDFILVPGMRIIPENEIEEEALSQIWDKQCLKSWSLTGKTIPWDRAEFRPINEWWEEEEEEEGFAIAEVALLLETSNPLRPMVNLDTSLKVYWLWESDEIRAYWTVGCWDYNDHQTNQAGVPLVFY